MTQPDPTAGRAQAAADAALNKLDPDVQLDDRHQTVDGRKAST